MHELKPAARVAAKPLVEALPSSIYALSVVDGSQPGKVYVDNPDHPTVTLVWEDACNAFISSEPTAKGLPSADVIRHSEPPPGGVRAPGSADQGEAHVFCRVHSPGMGHSTVVDA